MDQAHHPLFLTTLLPPFMLWVSY